MEKEKEDAELKAKLFEARRIFRRKVISYVSIILILIAVVSIVLSYEYTSDGTVPIDEAGEKNYVSTDLDECSRTQILCVEGFEFFSDETGCGCEAKDQ